MNGDSVLRFVAILALWVAPLPAAFFVGRSVWWHLCHNWHTDLGALGLAAALLTGGMVELIGILSAHVALACWRWNHRGDVKTGKGPQKPGARERAPFALAAVCFLAYAVVAIALAVVLEARPELAIFAPALVTAMAADAYISLGVYEQHRDRLARYSLQWNWKAQPDATATGADATAQQSERKPARVPQFETKLAHVAWLHEQEPELQPSQLAAQVGCSVSTVSRALASGNHRGQAGD